MIQNPEFTPGFPIVVHARLPRIRNPVAYLTIRDTQLGRSTFWTVNLATGAATSVGEVGGGAIISAMTVVPTPGTAVAGLAVLALGARRRR